MALEQCTEEITDCDLKELGDSQLFRKLIRAIGGCFGINTFSSPSYTNAVTGSIIIEADDNSSLQTAIDSWITDNPDYRVIAQSNQNSISKQGICITYIDLS